MITDSFAAALARFQQVLSSLRVTAAGQELAAEPGLRHALALLRRAGAEDRAVYLIGNGGSAALVAHVQNDLVNKARLRAHVLHEPALMTCMSNDYGYARAYAELLERYLRSGDILIAVSSSGRSANILAAIETASTRSAEVITLSGFAPDNPLRGAGHVNIWLPSDDYGEVEVGHQLVLHYLSDALAGK
ncbi:hypothetical protein VI26_06140 [Chromobacterium sp. LK1]|uniref:D-sedoheptulose-7-phosphate isomerase n=1 Tax=Chromobacterium sp. LK1 TaxID=1628193 RepID=UPI0006539C2A|nr:SIS domain-containing protein [Chromobacterium sp. LK1]KMN36648.1 hypothetical protein VI26_06140 [Chromobacterium sp. LK1]